MSDRLLFELGAGVYDALTDNAVWRAQARELLPRDAGLIARVLDVGCGPGVSALALADALTDARVVGLDLAARMLARARGHIAVRPGGLRVRLVRGDATRLPFGDASFDLVTGHSLLYLVPDRASALSEARRVLRPGGQLALMEPRAGGSLLRAARHGRSRLGAALRATSAQDVARFATSMTVWRFFSGGRGRIDPAVVEPLLRAAGFASTSCTPTLGGLGLHVRAKV